MKRLIRYFCLGYFIALAISVLVVSLAFAGNGFAQGSRKDDIVFNAQGRPMAGATVRICTSAATGQPCSPLASVYSDPGLTQALANPLTADGMGNYTFYAAPGRYEIEISGPGITTKQLPNVILPSDPSAPTFTTVTTTSGISAFSLSLAGNLTVNGSISVAGTLSIGGLPIPAATVDNQWTANQRFKGPIPWRDVTTFMPAGGCSTTATDAGANTTGTIILGSATTLSLAAAKDFKTGCGIAILGAGAAPTIVTPPSAISLSSVTSSSNIVTVTSSGNHNLVVGSGSGQYQGVQVTGCSNTAYNGTYPIQTITDTTHFTYNTTASGTGSATGCSANVFFGYAHGVTGSTSYSYKIAAIDANMGVTAASTAAVTVTNGNATLSKYNYNHVMWANETGAYMWVVYRNSGSGYSCVGTSFGGGFEDMGFNFPCPVFVPSTPPSTTTADALNTTIAAGGGSTMLTLATAATTAVTTVNVYHDESSFFTACVNAVNSDQSGEAGSYGCYLPAGNYWINGEMPTASILPAPGVMKIAIAGSLVFHTIPWFISQGRYDIEGIGGGAQAGSFQHGGYTPIETSATVPAAVALLNPPGGTVTFSGFTVGDNGLLDGDGIFVEGGALSFDNDYVTVGTFGAGFRVEGAVGLYMNHIGVQGGAGGGLSSILWDMPFYDGGAGCCWYIRDLFTANHGLGFMGPGGNGAGNTYNTLQVTDWLQENMDPLDNGLIQIDTGPNAPGQINGAGFPLLGVGLLNVSNSDVAAQYQNIFSTSSLTGSAPVQSASLVNVQSGGSLAVCVNGAACPLSLINVFSNSTPPNLSAGFGSSGFAQSRSYGLPTTNAANVSLGPTLFAQTFAGGGSYAIPAWAMVLPAPAGLSVTGTGSGSLASGTYCIGVNGVDAQPSGIGQTNLSNVVCQAVGSSGAINLSWYEGTSNSLNAAFSNFDLWYCVESGGVPCSPNNYLLNIATSGLDPVTTSFSSTSGAASGTPYTNSAAQFSWLSWDWNQTPYSCFFCTNRGHSDYWPVGFGMVPTGNAGYNIYTKLGVNVGTTLRAPTVSTASLDNTIYVDGVKYSTLSGALAALAANQTLVIPQNVTLAATATTSLNGVTIQCVNNATVTYSANVQWNFTGNQQTVTGCNFAGPGTGTSTYQPVIASGNDFVFSRNTVTGFGQTGNGTVEIVGGGVIEVCDNTIYGNADGALFVNNTTTSTTISAVRIERNHIDTTSATASGAEPIAVHTSTGTANIGEVVISGNVLRGTKVFCVEAGAFGGSIPYDVTVSGNSCKLTQNSTGGGYSIVGDVRATITGNVFDANGYTYTIAGIELGGNVSGSVDFAVTGNVINGGAPANTASGIGCSVGCQHIVETGNVINGFGTSIAASGIYNGTSTASGQVTDIDVESNTIIFPASGAGKGIWQQCNAASTVCSRNSYHGNNVYGSGTSGSIGLSLENDTGTSDRNNVGPNTITNVDTGLFLGANVTNTLLAAQQISSITTAATSNSSTGTISPVVVEYCGATSGSTQACAKTVENSPVTVFGDVTLNTATSQSITTLPFTSSSSYSCSGSDLTTAAGIVSFNTYAAASVTIAESGGVNTDHLRYMCVGY
ncbi:MAG: hypothetical protein ABSA96_08880 [Candidatus Acidiferrales bacterium]|jgi:hypothetical protein